MAWNYDRSRERIQRHLDTMGEIEIEKLVREADLESLLSETVCREIRGAHVYVQVTNFPKLASANLDDVEYKRLVRAIHIYQREVSRIIEADSTFGGLRVHFQGPKVHSLFYRPIDDDEELAIQAVLLQLVLRDFVSSVFNPAFPDFDDFAIAGGADLGDAIGTRNGARGDRELLFLGSPANHAAKIINVAGQLRLTENIYLALPEDLQSRCTEVGDGLYQLAYVSTDGLDDLLENYDVSWDREASAERIEDDKESFPLDKVAISSAEVLIDVDALSIYDNKRVTAASVFADVSGFTGYVEDAETEADQQDALRVFHAIRREMAQVVRTDFDGLRIQFQGDRVQALFHLPKDDEATIATTAVEAAIGLQSSMELTLKACLPEASSLKLAIGVDLGTTLVSKLGTRAHRDRICLGEPVEHAARNEERCEGSQIGISREVYDLLPEEVCQWFNFDRRAQCYVATGLTADKVDKAKRAKQLAANQPTFLRPAVGGVTITGQEEAGARKITPTRPWSTG